MSTYRTVTGPDDLEGRWVVVDDDDDEVELLEDVEWERPRRGQPALPEGQRKVVTAGTHRFTVGQTVELAEGAALETGFRDAVRSLWRSIVAPVSSLLVFAALHLVHTPWLDESVVRRTIVLVVATIPVVLGILGVLNGLTRSADGRVTRALAGPRMREAFDRQRGGGVTV
ncbi:hypothetical protein [Curtobacterium aetherium]|uniref:Uncharacterized protein n=1 Tax=Curtobacterium aetherium TaxID=2841594 RepID=A0ACD1E2U2_9MICO|nr:hypothetical protein [Curtobacterium sp. L6-1]QWS33146.1 hypothetical protein KM842_12960 [Curtobacterium sp. L6-1]